MGLLLLAGPFSPREPRSRRAAAKGSESMVFITFSVARKSQAGNKGDAHAHRQQRPCVSLCHSCLEIKPRTVLPFRILLPRPTARVSILRLCLVPAPAVLASAFQVKHGKRALRRCLQPRPRPLPRGGLRPELVLIARDCRLSLLHVWTRTPPCVISYALMVCMDRLTVCTAIPSPRSHGDAHSRPLCAVPRSLVSVFICSWTLRSFPFSL